MKIDIHVHTSERSKCGRGSETEQICAAISAGLDAIAFTDHHRLPPAGRIEELNDIYAPFKIFGGIEIRISDEDILVLGVHDSRLESEKWDYPSLHNFIKASGGFLAIAHPFRYHENIKLDINQFPPHAMEICSYNTSPAVSKQIFALSTRLEIPVLSNSDAHAPESLGRHYNVLDAIPNTEKELITMLRERRFAAFCPDTNGATGTFKRFGELATTRI